MHARGALHMQNVFLIIIFGGMLLLIVALAMLVS
ncbi:hypothetical protein AFEL58S_02914 [Afipia felis]